MARCTVGRGAVERELLQEGQIHLLARSVAGGNSRPRYRHAFSKHRFFTRPPNKASSLGSVPSSTSRPRRLHRIRRKYSWRGNDMNERESVTVPTKCASSPVLERALICHSIPSF